MNVEGGIQFHIGAEELGGAVHGALNKHHGERPKPLYLRRTAAAVSDGVRAPVLDCGTPPTGSLWQIIGLTLFGTDSFTTVAGVTGSVFTGNASQLGMAGLLFPTLSIPTFMNLSDKVFWVHSNENVCLLLSGPGVAGQQFGMNVRLLEWKEAEISHRTGR